MKAQPMVSCPVTYFEHNLFFNTNGNCWAAYRLGGFNYDFQSYKTQRGILNSLVHTIKNVSHMKILVVPTTEDVEQHYENLKQRIRPDALMRSEALYINGETCAELKKNCEDWNDYTTYLLVKLQGEAIDQFDLLTKEVFQFFRDPIYSAMRLVMLAPDDITAVEYQKYRSWEEETFQVLNSCLELYRLRPREMQWLLKRVTYKGLKKPVPLRKTLETVEGDDGRVYKKYTEDWQPAADKGKRGKIDYLRPYKSDIMTLFEGEIKCEGIKGVRVTHDDGAVSYQSYMALTNVPDIYFGTTDCEWIYCLQKQPIPVEICIDIENIYYQKAVDKLRNEQKKQKDQIKQIAKAGEDMPSDLMEARDQTETLIRELNDNKLPMNRTTVSICVAGTDLEQIDAQVKELKLYFDKREFSAVRPGADQIRLFMQHVPGSETYAADFKQPLSPFPIAGGIFGVNNRVGDNVGFYIGMANDKPVFLNMTQACRENKSPAATFFGDLGFGKSFNVNDYTYLHVINGGRAVVIDPKGERTHWRSMPLIGKHVNVAELTSDAKNKGLLDPFIMFANHLDHASELATSSIMDLLKMEFGSETHTILKNCVKKVKNGERPCMQKIVQALDEIPKSHELYKAARSLYLSLESEMDNGLSTLIFGDGTEQAISLDGPLNVICFKGLALPERGKLRKDFSPAENISSVLVSLAVDFIKQFAWSYPNVSKLAVIDESWMLAAIPAGSDLIKSLARMGRSLYIATILNGHSVLDLPSEELRTTMTYKFCFHTSDEDEARRMLDYLKLDATPENIGTLMNLRNAECLFSDMNGRVAKLKFDAVFGDLIKFFSTTPDENKSVLAETVPKEQDADEATTEPVDTEQENTDEEAVEPEGEELEYSEDEPEMPDGFDDNDERMAYIESLLVKANITS